MKPDTFTKKAKQLQEVVWQTKEERALRYQQKAWEWFAGMCLMGGLALGLLGGTLARFMPILFPVVIVVASVIAAVCLWCRSMERIYSRAAQRELEDE